MSQKGRGSNRLAALRAMALIWCGAMRMEMEMAMAVAMAMRDAAKTYRQLLLSCAW